MKQFFSMKSFALCAGLLALGMTANAQDAPQADMIDVQFLSDGSCYDKVTEQVLPWVPANGPQQPDVYYNEALGMDVARFHSPYGGGNEGAWKFDFEGNNDFRKLLADGHSVEAMFCATYDGQIPDVEAKFFSAMEGGGTGFLICKKKNGKNGENEITFLPNVNEKKPGQDWPDSKWIWCTSGVVPQSGEFYHVVGVWNQQEGKAYIYVNGELKNTVDAKGDLRFANTGSNWWGIGTDANKGNGGNAWNGEVAIARLYSEPLTADQVKALYAQVEGGLNGVKDITAAKPAYHFDGNVVSVEGDVKSLALYDLQGAKIADAKANKIDLSSKPAGVYLVKAVAGKSYSFKVVKK